MQTLLARLVWLLARWLHGLAARLERYARPTLAPATLSTLADRFPGAPDHWLRDIAEHVDTYEGVAADEMVPPEQEAEDGQDPPAIPSRAAAAPAHRQRPDLRIAAQREARSVDARQKPKAHPSRPVLRWLSAAKPARQVPDVGVSTHRSAAPLPAAPSATVAPRHWLKWIGRVGGGRALRAVAVAPDRSPQPAVATTAPQAQAERIFTVAKDSLRRRNPYLGDLPERVERSPLDRPQRLPSPTARQLRFESGHAGRPVQAWTAATEGCWPALPDTEEMIADAASAARPLHDFHREQMAGLWRG
jgi:hypothetical protein